MDINEVIDVTEPAFFQTPSKIFITCRICMQESLPGVETMIDLFTENKESKEILRTIFMCTQISLLEDSILPTKICSLCLRDLELANIFRSKCLLSQDTFSKYREIMVSKKRSERISIDIKSEELNEISESLETNIKDEPKLEYNITEDTENNNKCNVCGKILKTFASLCKHKISMHQNKKAIGKVTGHGSARLHHCLKCSYTTKRGQSLVYHMRTHTGEKPYVCECGNRFAQPASLAAHKKTHSTDTYHTCPKCGKQFKYVHSFRNHQRVHEAGTFVCGVCNKLLKSSDTLKAHMQRHYNIKNYSCEQCGSTFVTSAELINHRKKHAKLKTFECNLCDYKTHLKKLLITHIQRHTGERSHHCDLCEFSFYSPYDLVRHKRKHTHEKPYTCPVCEQKFKHSTSVNKHVRNVHKSYYLWNDEVDRSSVKVLPEEKSVTF